MNKENYTASATNKNIYYMFQRLITPIFISTIYTPYKDYWKEFNQLLEIVTNWLDIYYNQDNFDHIDKSSFILFDSIITDLKFNCLTIDTQFIEEIDIWHNEFLKIYRDATKQKEKK